MSEEHFVIRLAMIMAALLGVAILTKELRPDSNIILRTVQAYVDTHETGRIVVEYGPGYCRLTPENK